MLALLALLNGLLLVFNHALSSDFRDWLYFPLGFAGLGMCLLLGAFFLLGPSAERRLPMRGLCGAPLAWLAAGQLLWRVDEGLARSFLGVIGRRVESQWFPAFALALAALVFLPLAWRILRRQPLSALRKDLLAAGGLLAMALLIYLPHGFHSIASFESWIFRAWVEGMFSWSVSHELATRPLATLPHFAGALLSPGSFAAWHAQNMLFIAGKAMLFYGVLRKCRVSPLPAFLMGALCLLYPVNSHLFSLRSLAIALSAMSLAGGLFLALDWRTRASRLHVAGIWLALAICVFINEGGYALILVLPALWLWQDRGARSVNLALCFWLVPTVKAAWLLFLSGNRVAFYSDQLFVNLLAGGHGGGSTDLLPHLAAVYRHSFFDSWLAALGSLRDGAWLGVCMLALPLAAGVCWRLARGENEYDLPDARGFGKGLALGGLLILPAVGVFIFIEAYRADLWRLYYFVPEGAAIAVVCAAGLLCSLMRPHLRAAALCGLCLALALPAFAHALHKRERDVTREADKAQLMRSLVQVAPRIHDGVAVMLTSALDAGQLRDSAFAEFYTSAELDRSFYWLLYGGEAAPQAWFCRRDGFCRANPDEETLFNSESPEELLRHTLVIALRADLTAELIDDPAAWLGWDAAVDYDAGRLFDAAAPIPARAQTMLGFE